MQGQFIFLNGNTYTKDGEKRSYASFADTQGAVLNFNATAIQQEFPEAFSICMLEFQVQQFAGGKSAFILEKIEVIGQLKIQK